MPLTTSWSKGVQDYIASKKGILATVDSHVEEAMEAICGTGDTLSGIVAALIAAGREIGDGASVAARVNRLAGYYATPTPVTKVVEIIEQIPQALVDVLGS